MKAPSEEYLSYLYSPAWKEKRAVVIDKRGKKCEHCSARRRLQVHHLTYERLFSENEEDLMVLCAMCHEVAERGKDNFQIPKRGDVLEIRRLTLAWLKQWYEPRPVVVTRVKERIVYRDKIVEKIVYRERHEKAEHKERVRKEKKSGPRNPFQAAMMEDENFMHNVRTMDRNEFKKFASSVGNNCPRHWANSIVVFDRYHLSTMERIKPEDIVDDGMMIPITLKHIESGCSNLAGLTKRQFGCIGVPYPPQKGWKRTIVGQLIRPDMLKSFLSGR